MPISNINKGIEFTKFLPTSNLLESDFIDEKNSKYLYCRGFLVCKENNLHITDSFKSTQINNDYFLYLHEKCGCENYGDENLKIFILGLSYFVDKKYINDNQSNAKTLYDAYSSSKNDFLEALNSLAGRYVILVVQKDNILVYNDACGLKVVYYSTKTHEIASHIELLNKIDNANLSLFEQNRLEKKYNFSYIYLGNVTKYENIFSLLPNFELNLQTMNETRFYPNKARTITNDLEAIKKEYFEIMDISMQEIIKKNKKLCMSLTGGKDSRVSLYTTLKYKDRVYFFTENRDKDFEDSCEIAKKYNLKWIGLDAKDIHTANNQMKVHYDNIISNNIFPVWTKYTLQTQFAILNLFGDNDYIHIHSNCAEAGRGRAGVLYALPANEFSLEKYLELYIKSTVMWKPEEVQQNQTAIMQNDKIVRSEMEKYVERLNYDVVKKFGYNPWDFLYIEERVANYLSPSHMFNDIPFESTSLTNCRKVLEIMWKMPDEKINRSFALYNNILKDY